MKRLIILSIILLVCMFTKAETWTDDNGTIWPFYALESNNKKYAIIYGPTGTIPSDLIIPSVVKSGEEEYIVLSIGMNAFSGCTNLTSVTIPNSVSSIDTGAFAGCSNLTSVTIPDDIYFIGREAFEGTAWDNKWEDGLIYLKNVVYRYKGTMPDNTSIAIKEGTISISPGAFESCKGLTSITIPNSVIRIGSYAFAYCSGLTSFTIPENVITIESSTFRGCSGLTSLTIPDNVTSIGDDAFSGCSKLTSLTIPENIKTISEHAFRDCSGLISINIPAGFSYLNLRKFEGCSSLNYIHFSRTTPPEIYSSPQSYSLPYAIFFVPNDAVEAYKAVWTENVILPEASSIVYDVNVTAQNTSSDLIEQIGKENAINVVKLKVFGTINSYDMMVIRNKMINLRELDLKNASIVANDYEYYQGSKSQDNVFGAEFLRNTQIMSVILPTTVTSIGNDAFYNCCNLRTVTNLDGVTHIGGAVFYNCSNLSSINLPNNLVYIGGDAFYGCSGLVSIKIPESVTSIESSTFENCSHLNSIQLSPKTTKICYGGFASCSDLNEFHLPPYIQSIANNTFANCSNLKAIYAYMIDVPTISTNTFNDYQHQILYVPQFLYNKYYYDTNWSQFLDVRVCDLKPGDYTYFYTNSDVVFEDGERIDLDTPDVEIGEQGGVIVEGDDPQNFDDVEQNVDGEGTGGSIIGVDDNIIVNKLKVKLQVKASRWIGFNFPYDVTIADCEYPGQYVWIEYDGEARANGGSGWKLVEGTKLLANKGYMFMSSKNGKLIVTFDHPSFGDDKPHPLQSYTSGNAANAGWNFLGNPYSSYYALDENDFSAPVTIWNSTTQSYEAYRPGDDDIHLQPYQAFFVQMPEHVYIVNFNENRQETYTQSQQTQANQAKMRKVAGIKPERLLINLTISDNDTTTVDKTRLVLNEKASRGYELECDAAKFISDKAEAQLYLLENGVQMAIDERPTKGDICLGYMAKQAGKLRIEATRMDMPMVLVDTKTHQTFDLSLGNYEFETEAGTFDKRFMLRLSEEATAIKSLTAKTGVAVGLQDGGLSFGGAEGKSISIYNANGVLMTQQSGNGFVSLPSGLYLVKVDEISAKIYVK